MTDTTPNHPEADAGKVLTHRMLLPEDICPSFFFKARLTGQLDDPIAPHRTIPGDGYYWCKRTCTPVGPDDELVLPKACVSGRSCWEGIEA